MLKYIVFGFLITTVLALEKNDKCPNENEKPGLLEKYCEDEKFDIKKELTCVCEWFHYKDKDGKCVTKDECEKGTTTTVAPTTTPCPTSKPETQYCQLGEVLVSYSCGSNYGYRHQVLVRHYNYYPQPYPKKCYVCKKKDGKYGK
nr:uncharacterized protein LOC111421580 [Onthophagus taurus]